MLYAGTSIRELVTWQPDAMAYQVSVREHAVMERDTARSAFHCLVHTCGDLNLVARGTSGIVREFPHLSA